MIDKKLFKELKRIKGYWFIQAAVCIAAAFFTLFQLTALCHFVDGVLFKKLGEDKLIRYLLFFALFFTAKAFVTIMKDYYSKITTGKIKTALRKKAVEKTIEEGAFITKHASSAERASIILSSIENLEQYFSDFLPHLVYVAVCVPLILIYAFYLDPISAFILFFTAPLIPLFMILIGKTGEYVNRKQWHTLKQMNGYFSEILKGLLTLKLFNRVNHQVEKMKALDEAFRKNTMSVLRITFLSALVLELLTTISTALVAVSLGIRLLNGNIDFYSSFLVLLLTPEYFQPLRQMGAKYHMANNGKLAADSLYGILEEKSAADAEGEDVAVIDASVSAYARLEKSDMESEDLLLDVENLSYSYDKKTKVLEGLYLKLQGNQLIALAGDSGVGKTTLGMLIMGYDRSYSGAIRLNCTDIKNLTGEEIRRRVAYVPQNPILINGSILANILLGKENSTDEEISIAVKNSGMKRFIDILPNGLETIIGEGGHPLSGGQKQIIGICRALLKSTGFILFDEPTSAMDVESEELFMEVLCTLKERKGILVIAHRLSTLALADRVLYMEEGKITEEGTHKDLLKKKDSYGKRISEWGAYFDE